MDKNEFIQQYGSPKSWDNTQLYLKWTAKHLYAEENIKLITEEVNRRGGIEFIKNTYDKEKEKKQRGEIYNLKNKKLIKIISITIIVAIIAILYLHNTREQSAYKNAIKANTLTKYHDFLNKFPDSKHTEYIEYCYCKLKILEIYHGHNFKTNSLKEVIDVINDDKSTSSELFNNMNRLNRKMDEFNETCATIVNNDPILKEYFNSLIKKMNDNELSIETLNYYGIKVRQVLEKDLKIQLIK